MRPLILILVALPSCSLLLDEAGQAPDASTPDAEVADANVADNPLDCLPVSLLDDEFGTAVSSAWTVVEDNAGLASVDGVGAEMTYMGIGRVAVESKSSFLITDGEVTADITISDIANESFARLRLIPISAPENYFLDFGHSESLKIGWRAQALALQSAETSSTSFVGRLRIRRGGGKVLFESQQASDGGSVFRVGAALSDPFAGTPHQESRLAIHVEAGSSAPGSGPEIAVLSRLTLEHAPDSGWCAAASLPAPTASNLNALFDLLRDDGGTVSTSAMGSTLTIPMSMRSRAAILSRARYDFTGSTIEFELGEGEMNADFTLSLNESTANSVGFYRAGPTLIAGVFVDEADVGSGAVPFRIVEHRFLRIVIDELGQEVAFEHSADGGNWTEFYRKTTIPVALRRSKLSVAAVGTGVAGSLVLRDVRITRP